MSLQKINKLKDEKGFTIVELLIVIVVIGILAAITIVAFTGVQNRAKIAGYQSDANGIVKVAEGLNADNQAYPTGTVTAIQDLYHNSTTVKLPPSVRVKALLAAPAGADAITSSNGPTIAGNIKTYTVFSCANGANVYYWDTSATSGNEIKIAKAGAGC